MPETTPLTETIIIPGYRIEGLLGKGGMASVFLAIQESFERQVALKVMSPLLNSDPSFAARFKREARIVAQLSHASIVPVFDVGEYQSRYYLSMEYLPGGDLKQRILRGARDLNLALNVCTALSTALDLAHRKGFVHRDIKPENILFRADDTPVLTDFGIARALDNGRSMTLAGMLVGTPNYMSPEQVKGLELDGRSDLYAVGIVFFEILTGAMPFTAESTLTTALKHVSDPLPPLPPEYAAYQDFLDCLTAKDREDRFASGAEVVRALRVIGTGRAVPRSRPAPRTRTQNEAQAAAEEGAAVNGASSPESPSISQPTLARPRAANENPTLWMSPAADRIEAGKGARSASPGKPGIARGSNRPSAWQALAKPARTRQLLLGAVAVGVVLVVGAILFTLIGTDKGAGASGPGKPSVAARQEVSATAEPAGLQAPGNQTKAAVPGDQPVSEPVMNVATPVPTPATAASSATPGTGAEPAAALEGTQTAAVAQLPTSDSVVTTTPVAAAASAPSKHLTERQRQRKAQEARLIAQNAAELRATQLQAQEAHIQELLTAAKNEYDAGSLWQPNGASAADRYREILKLQPGRAEAVAGALRVANVLAAEAEDSEAAGDIYTSRLLIGQIQSLQPDHQKLGELQDRLEQLVASPLSLGARDRGRLEKAAKYIARATEDLAHQPFDYRAATDAVDEYDRAAATAAAAPGLPSLQQRLIAACAVAVRNELSNNEPKRAAKLIALARKHNWGSEDLDQLEASIQTGGAPTTSIKQAGTP